MTDIDKNKKINNDDEPISEVYPDIEDTYEEIMQHEDEIIDVDYTPVDDDIPVAQEAPEEETWCDVDPIFSKALHIEKSDDFTSANQEKENTSVEPVNSNTKMLLTIGAVAILVVIIIVLFF